MARSSGGTGCFASSSSLAMGPASLALDRVKKLGNPNREGKPNTTSSNNKQGAKNRRDPPVHTPQTPTQRESRHNENNRRARQGTTVKMKGR